MRNELKNHGGKIVKYIRQAPGKQYSFDEKIRSVLRRAV